MLMEEPSPAQPQQLGEQRDQSLSCTCTCGLEMRRGAEARKTLWPDWSTALY